MSVRVTEGRRLLLAVPGSMAEVAEQLGCARQQVGHWRKGTKRPGPAYRRKIEAAFGIPITAWDETPGTPAKARASTKRKARGETTRSPAETSTIAGVKAELATLHELDTKELTMSERLKIATARTQLLSLKARLERDQEQFEDRVIRKSTWWVRFESAFLEALKPHPDAARDVAEALAVLESA